MYLPKEKKLEDKVMWKEGVLKVSGCMYHYWMKVYEETSNHGIDGGKVSKLMIKRNGRNGEIVCNYDRGLGTKPKDPDAQLAMEIILHTNNF